MVTGPQTHPLSVECAFSKCSIISQPHLSF